MEKQLLKRVSSLEKRVVDLYHKLKQQLVGPQGPQGPQGALGPVGPAGLEWQGLWDEDTSYAQDDAVGYAGASWFCISAVTGTNNDSPVNDTDHWALLAAQGAQGQDGAPGPPGDINSKGGNIDTLGGVAMRTLYSKNAPTEYEVGVDLDLLKGGEGDFGAPYFPLEFFEDSVNYDSKTIHFRITGKWGTEDNTPTVKIDFKFGSVTFNSITFIGSVANGHPAEIMGEIMITKGDAYVCSSMGWCENNGTMRRWALSNPSVPVDISNFNAGRLSIVMKSGTLNSFTSYLAYVQVWN